MNCGVLDFGTVFITSLFKNFGLQVLPIDNLLLLLLQFLNHFTVEVHFNDWDSLRVLIETHLFKIRIHDSPLNFLKSFSADTLELLICLFYVLNEADVCWIKL